MSAAKLKGQITIAKRTTSDGEYMAISVTDKNSRVTFLTLSLGLEGMMQAITGEGAIPCEIEVRNLDVVGKNLETKNFEFPVAGFRDKADASYQAAQRIPPGWELRNYFDSQDSFFKKRGDNDEQWWARTTMYRWVDEPTGNDFEL